MIAWPIEVRPFDYVGQGFKRDLALQREASRGRALKELSPEDPTVQSNENLCALEWKRPRKVRYVGLPSMPRFQGEPSLEVLSRRMIG